MSSNLKITRTYKLRVNGELVMDNNNIIDNGSEPKIENKNLATNINNGNAMPDSNPNMQANPNMGIYSNIGVNAYNPYLNYKPNSYAPVPDHEHLKTLKSNFPYFFWGSALFAVVYAICRYKNDRGITTPIIAVLTFVFFNMIFKKIGLQIKTKTYPYMAAVVALGISNFCSDDGFVVGMNFWVALLLFVTFIIRNAYDCSNWTFSKHIFSMLESTFGIIPHMFMQYYDKKDYDDTKGTDEKKKTGNKTNIIIGVLISLCLLMVILPLLISADKFFGEAVGDFFSKIFNLFDSESNHTVFFLSLYTIISFLFVYGFIRKLCAHNISEKVEESTKLSASIAITINSVLGFIYIIFSGFQIYYLFLGRMTLPEYATFAEYAHEGFFQLVVVCLINMIMVLIFIQCFENTMGLKISLTVISASTYIMIASSTLRMIMYVKAYDLSYLRLFVFWALIVIFMAMNGIVIYTFKKDFPMFKYLLVATTILYIAFAYSNPTYIITKHNLERRYLVEGEYNSRVDLFYLKTIYNDGTAKAICEVATAHNDKELVEFFDDELSVTMDKASSDFRKFNLAELSEHNSVKKCYAHFNIK